MFRLFFLLWILFLGLTPISLALDSLKIELDERVAIGSLNDDLLFQWAGVAVDMDGNIFLSDALEYTIKKFDSDGRFLRKTGRKGKGPGEFLAPRYIDCTRDWVYVTDQEMWGIQVFDKDLHFVRHIPLSFPISDMKVMDDDHIALVTVSYETSGKIFIVNGKGKITRSFPYVEENSSFMMDMVDFVPGPNGEFYIAYSFQDKIEKFDAQGSNVWRRHLLQMRKVNKQKFNSFDIPTEVIFKDVAIDKRGLIYILGGHHSKHRSRDVYVLDGNGDLVASFVLPDPSHCLYIDIHGYLYSRANEGVTLKKYKLIYGDDL